MIRPPPKSTLFPSTTLFLSSAARDPAPTSPGTSPPYSFVPTLRYTSHRSSIRPARVVRSSRSEEHTSELQSRQYLVCRLLLEKKKKNTSIANYPSLT